MPSLLEIGLANAVCAGLLALLALAAGRVCRRPAILHGLWLLVLVKLVTPPLFSLPVRVLPAEEPATVAVASTLENHGDQSRSSLAIEETPVTGQFLLLPSPSDGEFIVAVKLSGPMAAPAPAPPPEPAPVVAEPTTAATPP